MRNVLAAKCELAGEILRSFGSFRFTATGWSMLPALWTGDTLIVERINPDQYQVGDIALVGRRGTLCAHRVVCLPENNGGRFWITQGDAIPAPDRPVLEAELLGRVTQLIRSGKSISVSANLRGIKKLLAQVVRRSAFAARVFVYVASKVRAQREAILPCQG
ncbi:MAG: Peptidase conserved region [Candidatus Sulfotelmatobacter sp.]|nr:Peptidase conserved region [Candidatus Sulfotelmatobacter sp.]